MAVTVYGQFYFLAVPQHPNVVLFESAEPVLSMEVRWIELLRDKIRRPNWNRKPLCAKSRSWK